MLLLTLTNKQRYLFFGGLILKIILSLFFASSFMKELFVPFINYAFEESPSNSYQYFTENGEGNEFPYPPLMLYILLIPRVLLSPIITEGVFSVSTLHLFTLRLPLLLFDFVIFSILLKWLPRKKKEVLCYYWWSPILLYISYIHGQLDVIPIGLLFISLFFLFKESFFIACFSLALAVACKLNILITAPFFIWYAWKSNYISKKQLLLGGGVGISTFIFLIFPYFEVEGFYQMVFNNKEQAKIFSSAIEVPNSTLSFIFIPSIYFILLVRLIRFKFFNRNLALLFIAFSFGTLTLFIPPMQGWYYWTIPFFIYFIIQQERAAFLPFVFVNFFYFLYFLLIPNSDFLNVFQLYIIEKTFQDLLPISIFIKSQLVNIAFTLLQTSLLVFCIFLYQKGIIQIMNNKLLYRPFLIGVGGDSGAGKTTISENILQVFGKENTSIFRGDDMHKWERGDDNWEEFTHLNPKANLLHNDQAHALDLKLGNTIHRRHYDHSNGKFTLPKKIKSNKIVLFEGLHSFYLNGQSELYDLKIFAKPDEKLRLHWKICRDIKKRGTNKEKVLKQIKKRQTDSELFVQSQEKNADLVISITSKEIIEDHQIGNPDLKITYLLKIKCSTDFYLEEILTKIAASKDLEVNHFYDNQCQKIEILGNIPHADIEKIAKIIFPDLEIYGIHHSQWKKDYDGVIQLLICAFILKRTENNSKNHQLEYERIL